MNMRRYLPLHLYPIPPQGMGQTLKGAMGLFHRLDMGLRTFIRNLRYPFQRWYSSVGYIDELEGI